LLQPSLQPQLPLRENGLEPLPLYIERIKRSGIMEEPQPQPQLQPQLQLLPDEVLAADEQPESHPPLYTFSHPHCVAAKSLIYEPPKNYLQL
jgi:hypothetical protein